jgi:hypothetical protein
MVQLESFFDLNNMEDIKIFREPGAGVFGT